MATAKYQFEDFLTSVNNDYKDFVITVHELFLQAGYKRKVESTKNHGLQLSYAEPKVKGVKGIVLIFLFRNDTLMARIYAENHGKYPDVLSDLPEKIVSQIDKADDCKKMIDPTKCWTGCMGFDFHIRGKRYQKCYCNCFQLKVEAESMASLLALMQSEINGRHTPSPSH